jgi:hypothetical protein
MGIGQDDHSIKTRTANRESGKLIASPKKTQVFKVQLPLLQYKWTDSRIRDRQTAIVHLPAGAYRLNPNTGTLIVTGHILSPRLVQINLDWTEHVVLQHRKYNKKFKHVQNGEPVFNHSHAKVVAHGKKVKLMKGSSSRNRVICSFVFETLVNVEMAFTDAEGYDGFSIMRMGDSSNPEIYCHMEFMGAKDGYQQTDDMDPQLEDLMDGDSSSDDDSYVV